MICRTVNVSENYEKICMFIRIKLDFEPHQCPVWCFFSENEYDRKEDYIKQDTVSLLYTTYFDHQLFCWLTFKISILVKLFFIPDFTVTAHSRKHFRHNSGYISVLLNKVAIIWTKYDCVLKFLCRTNLLEELLEKEAKM